VNPRFDPLRRPILPTFAVATLLLLAMPTVAPTADAHTCIVHTDSHEDPQDCDAHDCGNLKEGLVHGHIVYHDVGDGSAIHGCGPLLHVGADGELHDLYLCVEVPAAQPVCVTIPLPARPPAGGVVEALPGVLWRAG